jgi:uncharacterized membrane protein YvbJ
MAVCPQCGATVAKGAVVCGSCNALITSNSAQAQSTNVELNARLQRAMRRTELLSYAAAGLGLAILAVIIILSFISNNPGVLLMVVK